MTEEPLEEIPEDAHPADEADEPDEPDEPRRYPSTIGGAFYIGILAVCGIGIGIAVVDDWRLGIRIAAVALMVAAGVRLLLPDKDAGMLAVRHRLVDVFILAAMGGIMYFLAVSIPASTG